MQRWNTPLQGPSQVRLLCHSMTVAEQLRSGVWTLGFRGFSLGLLAGLLWPETG